MFGLRGYGTTRMDCGVKVARRLWARADPGSDARSRVRIGSRDRTLTYRFCASLLLSGRLSLRWTSTALFLVSTLSLEITCFCSLGTRRRRLCGESLLL
jgi:hypothetical protein